jgi:hypothetical protein
MTTSLTMNRNSLRQIAAVIAIVMTFASVPVAGVIAVDSQAGPSFTLDICHPLQSLDQAPNAVTIARPAQPVLACLVFEHKLAPSDRLVLEGKAANDLDSPPPKLS